MHVYLMRNWTFTESGSDKHVGCLLRRLTVLPLAPWLYKAAQILTSMYVACLNLFTVCCTMGPLSTPLFSADSSLLSLSILLKTLANIRIGLPKHLLDNFSMCFLKGPKFTCTFLLIHCHISLSSHTGSNIFAGCTDLKIPVCLLKLTKPTEPSPTPSKWTPHLLVLKHQPTDNTLNLPAPPHLTWLATFTNMYDGNSSVLK